MTQPGTLSVAAHYAGLRDHRRALAKVRENTKPAMLTNLKVIYQNRGQTPASLSALTGIPKKRLQKLANFTGMDEPWLDEAYKLHRALGTPGIAQLMVPSGNLTESPMGISLESDVAAFRSGAKLNLSLACRVALKLGLDDPAQLIIDPLVMQVWDVVGRNERGAEPGCCPWCLADIHSGDGHLPTCLPHNLYSPRNVELDEPLMFAPTPKSTSHRRNPSARGVGIRPLRARLMKTQAQFGELAGIPANTIARVERCEVPLSQRNAEKIAAAYNVPVQSLYVLPEGWVEREKA